MASTWEYMTVDPASSADAPPAAARPRATAPPAAPTKLLRLRVPVFDDCMVHLPLSVLRPLFASAPFRKRGCRRAVPCARFRPSASLSARRPTPCAGWFHLCPIGLTAHPKNRMMMSCGCFERRIIRIAYRWHTGWYGTVSKSMPRFDGGRDVRTGVRPMPGWAGRGSLWARVGSLCSALPCTGRPCSTRAWSSRPLWDLPSMPRAPSRRFPPAWRSPCRWVSAAWRTVACVRRSPPPAWPQGRHAWP